MPLLARSWSRLRRGGSILEYALLASLIATVAAGVVVLLGNQTARLADQAALGDAALLPAGASADGGSPPGAAELRWTPLPALQATPAAPTPRAVAILANVGNASSPPLSALQIEADFDNVFRLLSTTCVGVLLPGEVCEAHIEATPLGNGTFSGALAGPADALPLTVVASGFAPAFAWSGGDAFNVTNPSTTPAVVEHTFTLTNVGTLAGTPATPTVSGSGTGFTYSLVTHTCTGSLAVGGTCTATVRATYTTNVASATGTLGGPATRALTGSASGFAPAFAWSGGGAFNVTNPSTNPAVVERTFILTNVGTLAGTPATPTVSGSGTGFTYSLVAHTCTGSLVVGGTCIATVRATYTANVASATGTLGGPAVQALTGSASGFVQTFRTYRVVGVWGWRNCEWPTRPTGLPEAQWSNLPNCPPASYNLSTSIGHNTGVACPTVGQRCIATVGACAPHANFLMFALECQ